MSGDATDPTPAAAARRATGIIALVGGGLMHLMVGGFYLASGLVAPLWAVLVLAAVWLGLAVLLWRWRRRRPLVALLLPFVAAAVWWLTVTAGERWLGWTA